MPILPENRHKYPDNWKEIRAEILNRAKDACEFCGLRNHIKGIRDSDGYFYREEGEWSGVMKQIKIVLTIAHLDHDPTNNDFANLRALCQQCHNRYDAEHRATTRRQRQKGAERGKDEPHIFTLPDSR